MRDIDESRAIEAIRGFLDSPAARQRAVTAEWLAGSDPVRVKALPTQYGPLDYELWREGPRRLRMRVGGHVAVPPGGIALAPPTAGTLYRIEVNGAPREVSDPAALVLRELPAEVLISN